MCKQQNLIEGSGKSLFFHVVRPIMLSFSCCCCQLRKALEWDAKVNNNVVYNQVNLNFSFLVVTMNANIIEDPAKSPPSHEIIKDFTWNNTKKLFHRSRKHQKEAEKLIKFERVIMRCSCIIYCVTQGWVSECGVEGDKTHILKFNEALKKFTDIDIHLY